MDYYAYFNFLLLGNNKTAHISQLKTQLDCKSAVSGHADINMPVLMEVLGYVAPC